MKRRTCSVNSLEMLYSSAPNSLSRRLDLRFDEILLFAAHAEAVQQCFLHRESLLLITVELLQKFIHALRIISGGLQLCFDLIDLDINLASFAA